MTRMLTSAMAVDTHLDLESPEFQRNPYPTYSALRRLGPVLWSEQLRCYLVLGYNAACDVLRSRDYTVDSPFRASRQLLGRTVMDVDGAEHARLRSLINQAFVPNAIPGYVEKLMKPVVETTIDGFLACGRFDVMSDFGALIPLRVLAHIIGIPLKDFEFFRECSLPIIAYLDSTTQPGIQEVSRKAVANLKGYLAALIHEEKPERRLPSETAISLLVREQQQRNIISDEEIINQVCLLIPAAIDTTMRLIGNTLYCLCRHPEQMQRVVANPALLPGAIEETLRFEPPIHSTIRLATKPMELHGVPIKRGAMLNVFLAAANRDEDQFPEPDRFDVSRNSDRHLAFGLGRHQCMGRQLAVVEVREALSALLQRCRNLRFTLGSSPAITGLSFRAPVRLDLDFDRVG